MKTNNVSGCRILVVEDQAMIAELIEGLLLDLGCVVVGPVARLDAALRLARGEELDGAILDVTLRGEFVYPVAEELIIRNIPFVLASGYGAWALPEAFRDRPRLTKPFTGRQLQEQVVAMCSGAQSNVGTRDQGPISTHNCSDAQ